TLSIFYGECLASEPAWPPDIVGAQSHPQQPARRPDSWHCVAWQCSGHQINNNKRHTRGPRERTRESLTFFRGKTAGTSERQQNRPWQKVDEPARNVPDPAGQPKIVTSQAAGELAGPFGSGYSAARRMSKRNCPSRKNSKHDQNTS